MGTTGTTGGNYAGNKLQQQGEEIKKVSGNSIGRDLDREVSKRSGWKSEETTEREAAEVGTPL